MCRNVPYHSWKTIGKYCRQLAASKHVCLVCSIPYHVRTCAPPILKANIVISPSIIPRMFRFCLYAINVSLQLAPFNNALDIYYFCCKTRHAYFCKWDGRYGCFEIKICEKQLSVYTALCYLVTYTADKNIYNASCIFKFLRKPSRPSTRPPSRLELTSCKRRKHSHSATSTPQCDYRSRRN